MHLGGSLPPSGAFGARCARLHAGGALPPARCRLGAAELELCVPSSRALVSRTVLAGAVGAAAAAQAVRLRRAAQATQSRRSRQSRRRRGYGGARLPRLAAEKRERPEPVEREDEEPGLLERFLRPTVVNPNLIYGDLLACLSVPQLEVLFLVQTRVYTPLWLLVGGAGERGVVAPAIAHSASLAACWLFGALATRAFEASSVDRRDLAAVTLRCWAAAFVALCALVVSTELGLWIAGTPPSSFGALGLDVDLKLLKSHVDVVADAIFLVAVLSAWRLAYAREAPS